MNRIGFYILLAGLLALFGCGQSKTVRLEKRANKPQEVVQLEKTAKSISQRKPKSRDYLTKDAQGRLMYVMNGSSSFSVIYSTVKEDPVNQVALLFKTSAGRIARTGNTFTHDTKEMTCIYEYDDYGYCIKFIAKTELAEKALKDWDARKK